MAGYHRADPSAALIAATAQHAAIGVHHYQHFDRLAGVLHFDTRWIAAPGSL